MRILTLLAVVLLCACTATNPAPPFEQHLEFNGFKVERGVYVANEGWHFEAKDDGTYVVARMNDSGGTIEPCECALETGGSCDQASIEDENGNITEIWCVDSGCGFCVGGVTTDPDDPSAFSRFRLDCVDAARVMRTRR